MTGRKKAIILIGVILGGAFVLPHLMDNIPFVLPTIINNTSEKSIPNVFDLANDNEHIAWIGTSDIVIYNYISNEEISTFRTRLSYVKDIAWSPDSSKIAVAGFIGPNENPARVEVYDMITLDLVFEIEFDFEDDYQVTGQKPFLKWSADGKYLFGEILHSQMNFESDDYTEDSYEKHILLDTVTWDTVWEYNVPIYNGHSHVVITDSVDRVFLRTGDGLGSISLSMIDPLTADMVEFNIFENRNVSSEIWVNDILWGNDTTIIIMAVQDLNYLGSQLFYSFDYHSDELILLHNTTNINEPIMNFDGTLVTDYYSDQFNPIHSIINQKVVYTIEHPFQELYGKVCFDICAISVPHQWSTFSNIIAYANYYEDAKDYELVIFDIDNSVIIGIVPEL